MPVVVTGAGGFVGRALVPRLVEGGSEVRALIRDRAQADPLRAVGAKVAVLDISETDELATVMRDAHTVCHLAGGLALPEEAYEPANVGLTRSVVEAATDAAVTRILFLSYPGASPDSANAYLRAKGRAEEAVRSSGLQHAILRSTHVYGPGSRWLSETAAAARLRIVVGDGSQRLAPVFVDDVAGALAAADDRAAAVQGTFGLQGPDVLTADELAERLAGRGRRLHLPPAVVRLLRRGLSRTMLEVLAADSLADAPDAAAEFGLALTPLRDGLAASGI